MVFSSQVEGRARWHLRLGSETPGFFRQQPASLGKASDEAG